MASNPGYIPGLPRIGSIAKAVHRRIFLGDIEWYLAGGRIIDGTNADDPGNSPDVAVLRPGTLMGQITSSGLYGTSVIDTLQSAYTAGGTSLALTVAGAAALNRRVGASGNLTLTGPPVAGGIVARATVAYSAINLSTGAVTITSPGISFISGSFVQPTDGSQDPVTPLPDGWNWNTLDVDGQTRLSVPFQFFPVGGLIQSSQLLPWPSDASLQAWIVGKLSNQGGSKFIFDHLF
jgi:hypothetical protein